MTDKRDLENKDKVRSKTGKRIVTACRALGSVVMSAFGINGDDYHDDMLDGSRQDEGYPEELFEQYKYK